MLLGEQLYSDLRLVHAQLRELQSQAALEKLSFIQSTQHGPQHTEVTTSRQQTSPGQRVTMATDCGERRRPALGVSGLRHRRQERVMMGQRSTQLASYRSDPALTSSSTSSLHVVPRLMTQRRRLAPVTAPTTPCNNDDGFVVDDCATTDWSVDLDQSLEVVRGGPDAPECSGEDQLAPCVALELSAISRSPCSAQLHRSLNYPLHSTLQQPTHNTALTEHSVTSSGATKRPSPSLSPARTTRVSPVKRPRCSPPPPTDQPSDVTMTSIVLCPSQQSTLDGGRADKRGVQVVYQPTVTSTEQTAVPNNKVESEVGRVRGRQGEGRKWTPGKRWREERRKVTHKLKSIRRTLFNMSTAGLAQMNTLAYV